MNEFVSFVVAGVVTGSIYAVTAEWPRGHLAKSTGVFNFAHGAVGMVMAYLYWQLWQGWGWNPVLSLAIVLLVIAPLSALAVERVLMRPLYGSALSTMIVVTLGLFLVLYGLVSTVWDQTITRNLPNWFEGDTVGVLGVNLSYEQVITFRVRRGRRRGPLDPFFKLTRVGTCRCGPWSTTPGWPPSPAPAPIASPASPGSSASCWPGWPGSSSPRARA